MASQTSANTCKQGTSSGTKDRYCHLLRKVPAAGEDCQGNDNTRQAEQREVLHLEAAKILVWVLELELAKIVGMAAEKGSLWWQIKELTKIVRGGRERRRSWSLYPQTRTRMHRSRLSSAEHDVFAIRHTRMAD